MTSNRCSPSTPPPSHHENHPNFNRQHADRKWPRIPGKGRQLSPRCTYGSRRGTVEAIPDKSWLSAHSLWGLSSHKMKGPSNSISTASENIGQHLHSAGVQSGLISWLINYNLWRRIIVVDLVEPMWVKWLKTLLLNGMIWMTQRLTIFKKKKALDASSPCI